MQKQTMHQRPGSADKIQIQHVPECNAVNTLSYSMKDEIKKNRTVYMRHTSTSKFSKRSRSRRGTKV